MTPKAFVYAWEIGLGLGVIAASAIITIATIGSWGFVAAWALLWVRDRLARLWAIRKRM